MSTICPHCHRALSTAFLRTVAARNPEAFMPKEEKVAPMRAITLDIVKDHGKTRVIATRNPSGTTRP